MKSNIKETTRYKKEKTALSNILDELYKFSISDEEINLEGKKARYFIQFSNLSKLGIKVTSDYNTPLGIYAYPVTGPILDQLNDFVLPFAQDRKYIVLFKADENLNIIDNNTINEAEYKKLLQKMLEGTSFKNWGKVAEYTGKEFNPEKDAKIRNSYFGQLWYAFWFLKRAVTTERSQEKLFKIKNVSSVVWNVLMRKCGIDGAVDYFYEGVIHENEPSQAVFFSAKGLKVVKIYDNKFKKETNEPEEGQQRLNDLLIRLKYDFKDINFSALRDNIEASLKIYFTLDYSKIDKEVVGRLMYNAEFLTDFIMKNLYALYPDKINIFDEYIKDIRSDAEDGKQKIIIYFEKHINAVRLENFKKQILDVVRIIFFLLKRKKQISKKIEKELLKYIQGKNNV